MTCVMLASAIACEVAGTLALRVAMTGQRRFFAIVVAAYLAAFGLLALALDRGLGLGVAYGIWAATGVALTAVASRHLFGEPLTMVMGVGVALIASGVLLIEAGAH